MTTYQSRLDNFPEIDVYKSNLENLQSLDLTHFSQKEIGSIVYKNAILIPNVFATIHQIGFNGACYYRVRKNINPTKEDLTQTKTFSYPEPCYCKENGRANIKHTSVFYCSDVAATSLLETKVEQNDTFYLSIWKPHVDRDVKAASYCKKVKRVENATIKEIELLKPLNQQISSSGQDKTEHLNYLNDFIADYFIKEQKPYSITSWLSNNILYKKKSADCIIYPSFETSSNFCNIAFHPNFVDKYLKIDKVIKLETEIIDNRYLNYSLNAIGEFNSTKIEWRNLTEAEKVNYHSIIKKGEELINFKPQ